MLLSVPCALACRLPFSVGRASATARCATTRWGRAWRPHKWAMSCVGHALGAPRCTVPAMFGQRLTADMWDCSGGRAASRPGALPSLTAGSTGRNGAAHLRASPGGVGTSFLKGLQEPTPDRPAHKPAQRPPAADSASPAFISDLQMADDLSQHSAMDMDVSEGDFMDIPESDFMDIPLDMDMVHSGNDSGFTTPGDHAHTLLAHPISPTSALSSPGTEHLGQPGAWSHQLPPVQRTAVPTTVVHTWSPPVFAPCDAPPAARAHALGRVAAPGRRACSAPACSACLRQSMAQRKSGVEVCNMMPTIALQERGKWPT